MTTQEIKTMYLASRNPALPRSDFPARWRRHGELAMSLPFWRNASGYLHGDVVAKPAGDADKQTPSAWTGHYDGVGSVYFLSTRALERVYTHPEFSKLVMDEHGAFAEPVQNFSVVVREEIIKERPGTATKMFAFLRAADGMSPAAFEERWRAHAALIMGSDALAGLVLKYIHNHAVPLDAAGESDALVRDRIETGLEGVLGIAELGFASRAELVAYLGHPDRDGIGADLAEFVDVDRMIIVETNEVTLSNRYRTSVPGRA